MAVLNDAQLLDTGEILLKWADGTRTIADPRPLRIACPCAACVHEWTGEKLLQEEDVPETIKPMEIVWVGRYALGIKWSDGHNTGIYSYDNLLKNSTEN